MTPASLFARKDLSRGLVTTFIILSTAGGGGGASHTSPGSFLMTGPFFRSCGWPDEPLRSVPLSLEVTSTDAERSRSPRRTR